MSAKFIKDEYKVQSEIEGIENYTKTRKNNQSPGADTVNELLRFKMDFQLNEIFL